MNGYVVCFGNGDRMFRRSFKSARKAADALTARGIVAWVEVAS